LRKAKIILKITKLFPLPSLIRLGDEYTKNNCRGRLESNRKKGKVKTKWS